MEKHKRVTLKDVAAAVDLAVPTVSQILNGKPNFCSAEKCAAVRRTAKRMGYITNIGYRIMTGMRTRTAGIIVASNKQMQEEHVKELILQLTAKLSDLGWAAFCHVLPDIPDEAVNKIREFIGRGTEKFIFIGSPFGYDEIARMLKNNGISCIGNRESIQNFCRSDSGEARLQLLAHLNKKTNGSFRIFWGVDEMKTDFFAWRSDLPGLKEKILRLPKNLGDYYEDAFNIGYDSIKKLFASTQGISGAMFPNDAYAIGAAQYLLENQINEFTLVGFNGDRALLRFPYPVSTGIQPIGMIVEEIAGFFKNDTPLQKLLPVELILK